MWKFDVENLVILQLQDLESTFPNVPLWTEV